METLEAEVREVTGTAILALIKHSIGSIGSFYFRLSSLGTSSEGLPGVSSTWFPRVSPV